MMGSEKEKEAGASTEDMERVVLDDPLTSNSYASYRSAMSTLIESHHPLSRSNGSTLAVSDPLLSPLPELDPVSPKTPDNIRIENSDYSDVIVSPLDEKKSNGDGNSVESPRLSQQNSTNWTRSESSGSLGSEYLKITVSNPQKEQETSDSFVPGSGTYVTYLITTRTNARGFGGSEFCVRRRFKDVVTLADRLAESYRGLFIPPRPDKGVVEGQVMHKQDFVEQRRVLLERYLRRLVSHPVVKKSNELRVFLQVPGKLPLPTTTGVASRVLDGAAQLPKQLFGESGSVMTPQEVVQPAKGRMGRMDLLRLFKEFKQSVTNDWGGSRPAVIEEDREFLERKERLYEFELRLTDASKQAEVLVKSQQDLGDTMGELGLTFIKLTKFENQEAELDTQRVRAGEMKIVATAAIKASRIHRELNAKTVKNLDTLHDYLGLVLAARNAFSDRSSALLTVQTLLSELSSLHSKAEKLESQSSRAFGGDNSRIQKLEDLKETLRVTEDAKNSAVRQYEQIKENNRSELERLDREKHGNLLNMLKGFVSDQAHCAEKLANLWTEVADGSSGYVKERSF